MVAHYGLWDSLHQITWKLKSENSNLKAGTLSPAASPSPNPPSTTKSNPHETHKTTGAQLQGTGERQPQGTREREREQRIEKWERREKIVQTWG